MEQRFSATWRTIFCLSLINLQLVLGYTYRLCYYKGIESDSCLALRKEGSQVECVKALDMSHCAILMNEGKADFGVFDADGLLLAHHFYPDTMNVLAELRHKKRFNEDFEFEAVAVVNAKIPVSKSSTPQGLCHPGFNESSTWNDYVLKYFEKEYYKSISESNCRDDLSVVENDAYNLRKHFGQACRPGKWVLNRTLDAELKRKYPELCALCDKPSCEYDNATHHGHYGALDCVTKGRGQTAYVALNHVFRYFEEKKTSVNSQDFKFLCPGGAMQDLNTTKAPCAWLKQPWKSVVVRRAIYEQLSKDLKTWNSPEFQTRDWQSAVLKILQADYTSIKIFERPMSSEVYLSRGRDIQLPQSCGKAIRWCTLNDMETSKCRWISAQASSLGIEPRILCNQTVKIDRSLRPASRESSLFQCFSKIVHDTADVMTIDSNYGLLVRQVYNMSNVLFCGTDKNDYSVVLIVLKEESTNNIRKLEDLRNKKACFPEYGGIAWLSFLNMARSKNLVSKCCDYPKIIADFFSGACAPGIDEVDRWTTRPSSKVTNKLCSICHSRNNDDTHKICAANYQNGYYGVLGAVKCLKEGLGDIAIIEVQHLLKNLSYYNLEPKEYRVLCKNGSLAMNTGFEVDDECALSVAIDSEVVSRRRNSALETTNLKNAFLKIEYWMGYGPDGSRPIRIYEPFNNTKDLLFKSSTNNLVDSSESIGAINVYKDVMSHVDMCTGSASAVVLNLVTLLVILLVHTQM